MGMAHILTVFEDALNFGRNNPAALADAVGKAVVKVCQDPDFRCTEAGEERVNYAPVLNHGNGVMHADEIHSTQLQAYVWMGNCLRPLHRLNVEELECAREMFEQKYAERKAELAKGGGAG